jgi:hypothetical protein
MKMLASRSWTPRFTWSLAIAMIASTTQKELYSGLLEEVKRPAVSGSNNNSDSAFECLQ